jgi:DNA-directed RNA polymerase alpha subunit
MSKQKNEIDEVLKASYRLELFIRKTEKQVRTGLIYEPSPAIKKDIEVLYAFVNIQKGVIEAARKAILTGEQKSQSEYLNTQLHETPLSTRTFLCLRSADINTVRDLINFRNKHGINSLSRFRNFGQTSFNEVITFINAVDSL